MPWHEVIAVDLRHQFVQDALHRRVPVVELCAAYGISRKTGYKFLARYRADGAAGLAGQSRRPHRSPADLEPTLLRSDNGVPFASQALGRLSTLAVWWIRLGILPDLMTPASPPERSPRADASHAQTRMHPSAGGHAPSSAAALRYLAGRVQRGAPA